MVTVMNFRLNKMWIISELCEELLASEEKLNSSDEFCAVMGLLNCAQYRADKNPPPGPSQINSVHNVPSCLLKIRCYVFLHLHHLLIVHT
jgi:hypothetical protein